MMPTSPPFGVMADPFMPLLATLPDAFAGDLLLPIGS